MFWTKVKLVASAVVAAVAVGTAVPLTVAAVRGAEPAMASADKVIECKVTELIPGGKVLLSAGSAQGVKEKFEFDVSRDGKPVGAVKVVAVEEKQATAEIASATGEIKVGDTARTRFGTVLAQAVPAPEVSDGLTALLTVNTNRWAPGRPRTGRSLSGAAPYRSSSPETCPASAPAAGWPWSWGRGGDFGRC